MLDKSISTRVFIRDDWKCRHCHERNGIDPHHVIYKSNGGKDEMNNLLTLCRRCHDGVHQKHLEIIVSLVLEYDLIVKFWRKGNWKP
jgi:5-methylcytosine-specific restriction endonuclease McrA